jgi:hypothetical protein
LNHLEHEIDVQRVLVYIIIDVFELEGQA